MKMSTLIARTLLCAAFIAFCPLVQSPASARASAIPWAGTPHAILCQPGFVYRCNSQGCFCVRP
jgi:hypothetical protein